MGPWNLTELDRINRYGSVLIAVETILCLCSSGKHTGLITAILNANLENLRHRMSDVYSNLTGSEKWHSPRHCTVYVDR